MSIATEDRGDGRSHVHSVSVECHGTASLDTQRERDGSYIARLVLVGDLYPYAASATCAGATETEAIAAALGHVSLTVHSERSAGGDIATDAPPNAPHHTMDGPDE